VIAKSDTFSRAGAVVRRGATRLGLVLFGLLVALALLEIILRVTLGPQLGFHLRYRKFDPLLGYTHQEHVEAEIPFPEYPNGGFRAAANNHGLREDSETGYQKPPGTYRVLVVGDSHTDGTVNNAETYPNVLESALVSQGLQADVLSAGVESYSPFTEMLRFHYYGRLYQPDIVLAGIYVGNDMKHMKGFEDIEIAQDGTVLIDDTPLQPHRRPIAECLADQLHHSYRYNVVKSKWISLASEGEIPPTEQAFRACRGCYWQSLEQAYTFHSGDLDLDQGANRLRNTLTQLREQVHGTGARLIVVLIPTKRQVEGPQSDVGRFAQAADILGLSAEEREFDELALRTALDACDRAQVEVLNLLPGLREAYITAREPLYRTTDWHLNPAGHRAVAAILKEIIP
jgi:hypothetical protein